MAGDKMDYVAILIFFLLFQVNCVVTGSDAYRTEGTITSPGYPAHYPNNVNKEWLIKTLPSASRISIVIDDQDIHETRGFECDDYLKIEEVEPYFMLYKQCGKGTIKTLSANGGKIKVSFKSDNLGSGRGFRLKWSVKAYKTTQLATVRSIRTKMPISATKVDATRKSSTGAIPTKAAEIREMTTKGTKTPFLTPRPDTTQTSSTGAILSEGVELGTTASTSVYVPLPLPNIITKHTGKGSTTPRTIQPSLPVIDGLHRTEKNFPQTSTSLEIRGMNTRNLKTHSLSYDTVGQYISEPKNPKRLGGETIGSLLSKSSKSNQRKSHEEYPIRNKPSHELTTLINKYFSSISIPFDLKGNKLSGSTTISKSSITYETKKKINSSIYVYVTASQSDQSSYNSAKLTTAPVATKENTTQWTNREVDVRTKNPSIKWFQTTENTLLADVSRTKPPGQGRTTLKIETFFPPSMTLHAFIPVTICVAGFLILLLSFLVLVVYIQKRKITRLKKVSDPKYLYKNQRYNSISQVGCRQAETLHLYEDVYRFRPVKVEQNENEYISLSSKQSGNERKLNTFVSQDNVSARYFCPDDLTAIKERADYSELLPETNTEYLEPVSFRSKETTPMFTQNTERTPYCPLNEIQPEIAQEYEMLNF